MFATLTSVGRDLRRVCQDLDPDAVTPEGARAAIADLARIEKQAVGARLRMTRCLEADRPTRDWLAEQTGQNSFDTAKDLETAQNLDGLTATDLALRDGELSADQAREVASAAADDPTAEADLLDTAREASFAELRRKAKAVRAAATDAPEKNRRAHKNRTAGSGVDTETGEAWMRLKGPAAVIAQLLAFLEPFVQAEFKKGREEGRRETRGAYMFDALVALFAASTAGRGNGVGPPVRIIVRVDATALKRGHAIAGETCEIAGIGPVPLAAILELLPQATIDVIVTDGEDVWNVTNLARRTTAHQQAVLWWLGIECARLGCGATRHLQIDHRLDWATTHVTELRALEWMCIPDHHRKTHDGWALVPGRGKRRMVPPEDPDHPNNASAQTDTGTAA